MNKNRANKKRNKAGRIVKRTADTTALTLGAALRTVLKVASTVLLVVLLTAVLFTCVFAYYVKTDLATNLDISLTDFKLDLTSTMYYQDPTGGMQVLTTLDSSVNRTWVDLPNIPIDIQHAAVAIEDKRFYEHKGVDWYRTVGAFANMFLKNDNTFGGSTITQQLIKNLTHEDDVTVQRKLTEIFRALDFEKTYTKDEIMEAYLNVVYFGEKANGVQAAAQVYFNKNVWELDLAECACIVGITNNPSLYDPYVSKTNNKTRQETILKEMYNQGYISQDEYTQAVNETLVFHRAEGENGPQKMYTYYEENVIKDVMNDLEMKKGLSETAATQLLYHGGLQIYTCMDKRIQDICDDVYQNRDSLSVFSKNSAKGQPLQSAIVMVDPTNGSIVALEGGVGEKTAKFGWDLATVALRSPGSSFKPLAVYSPAMDVGIITPNTLVNDSKDIKLSGTNWFPKNSGSYSGVITIAYGVQWSKNTVAAQVLDKLGLQVSYDYLTQKLGFTSITPSDMLYATLALGQFTHGVTVREMAQGYTAIANNGIFTYSRTYSQVLDSDKNVILDNTPQQITAFKANTAWNMTSMMEAVVRGGTGTEARLSGMHVAGKTGTTSDNYDRYFCGFTPYYIATVWTGYETNERMNFGNSNPAAVIWKEVMSRVDAALNLQDKAFPKPSSMGGDTGVFKNSLNVSPSPAETPTPPVETPAPPPVETPTPPPVETPAPPPVETPAPPVETPAPPPVETPAPPAPPPSGDAPQIVAP